MNGNSSQALTPRFRVVSSTDEARRFQPSPTSYPQAQAPQLVTAQPRFRITRPTEVRQAMYPSRPGLRPQMIRNDVRYARPSNILQPRQLAPNTMIRQPGGPRIMRPPGSQEENKKKLINILKSFLSKCSTYPDADFPQMIITTEQYLNGVISTAEYTRVLSQNTKGHIRDTLGSFLELYIYAVRKDIKEKKLSIEEVVPYKLVQSSQPLQVKPEPPSSYNSPSGASDASQTMQANIKSEPMSVPEHSVPSPHQITVGTSAALQAVKKESQSQSARSSPIMRTASPHMPFRSHASVGNFDTMRASPLVAPQRPPSQAFPGPEEGSPDFSLIHSPMDASEAPSQAIAYPVCQEPSSQDQLLSTQLSQDQHMASQDSDQTMADDSMTSIATSSTIISPGALEAFLRAKFPGVTIESPAFVMISEFLETRLKNVIQDAYKAAEHRSEQFRNNPMYVLEENPKLQLAMLEKRDRAERQRKADEAREAMMVKSGANKTGSTKAKEILKAEKEKDLNRDANEAAIAAIGGKKRTFQALDKKPDGTNGGPNSKRVYQPRVKQISMKDLQFAFERDPYASTSTVYRKMLYGLYNENRT